MEGQGEMVSHVTVAEVWEGEVVTCNGVVNNAVLSLKYVIVFVAARKRTSASMQKRITPSAHLAHFISELFGI
jgi:hypothetical protein